MSGGLKSCTHRPWKAETRRVKASSVHFPLPPSYCVSILTLAGLSYLTRRWRCLPMWPAVSQMIHHHRCRFIIGQSPRAPVYPHRSAVNSSSQMSALIGSVMYSCPFASFMPPNPKSQVWAGTSGVCVCSTCYVLSQLQRTI